MSKPEIRFNADNVSASIFINERDGKEYLNVVLQKGYKQDGEWKRTTNLSIQDIPKAQLVLSKCYEYAFNRKKVLQQPDKDDIDDTPF